MALARQQEELRRLSSCAKEARQKKEDEVAASRTARAAAEQRLQVCVAVMQSDMATLLEPMHTLLPRHQHVCDGSMQLVSICNTNTHVADCALAGFVATYPCHVPLLTSTSLPHHPMHTPLPSGLTCPKTGTCEVVNIDMAHPSAIKMHTVARINPGHTCPNPSACTSPSYSHLFGSVLPCRTLRRSWFR